MRYDRANKVERFLTYFIDFILLGVIVSAIVSGIFAVAGYDTKITEDLLVRLTEELNRIATGDLDLTNFKNIYTQYMERALFETFVNAITYLVLIVLYLIILPMVWKHQTLGRFIMKTKVVSKDGSEATKKVIIFRELFGSFLCYAFFGGVFIFVSAILVLSKERSLADYIGGSELISVKFPPKEETTKEEFSDVNSNESSDDYVDARFKEIDEDANNDKFKIDDDDYKII